MPSTEPIALGQRYLWQEQAVRVEALEAGRAVVKIDGAVGLAAVDPTELKPIPEMPGFEVSSLLKIDQDDWDAAVRWAAELDRILKTDSGRTAAVDAAAKRLATSARKVWKALAVYQENPTTTALLPRKPGRPTGLRLLDGKVEQIISDCIERDYLKPEKPSLTTLIEAIEAECKKQGVAVPNAKTVKARIEVRDGKQVVGRREGKKRAGEIYDGAAGHVEVSRALERVEIDHTLVDVILRADTPEREVVGRPWLTIAVDCFTRMIVGFYLSFDRPSAASVAMCLSMAALPKNEWLKAADVHGTWPVTGIPEQIWCDNAMEFRSEALRRGCERFTITLCYRPVGTPQIGGHIERLIGTMMGRVHVLPGTTQSNVQERGEYDSEARAVMTLSEFTAWFTEEVVTGYHLRPHRSLRGISPLQAWTDAMAGKKPRMPRDARDYMCSFLPACTRKLSRTGLHWERITYWADGLSPWVGKSNNVTVHYHPNDVGRTYVRLPDGMLVEATATIPGLSAVPLSDWCRRKGAERSKGRDPVLAATRLAGYERNKNRLAASVLATSNAKDDVTPPEDNAPEALPLPPRPARELVVITTD